MNSNKKKYYEQKAFWDKDYLENEDEVEKIKNVIEYVSADISKLLDIGCGNGALITKLQNTVTGVTPLIVGYDISQTALKAVKADKCSGNISDLPFKHKEFDIVTALEVLEHLPVDEFQRGVSEIQRVCRKRIIITVPNNDDLQSSLATCPNCYCKFSPSFHIRSFDDTKLCSLFTDFEPGKIFEIGPLIPYYNKFFIPMYRYWKRRTPPATAICPQCGYKDLKVNNMFEEGRGQRKIYKEFEAFCKKKFKSLLSSKKKRWLMAVYDRKN